MSTEAQRHEGSQALGGVFPSTRHSIVLASKSEDAAVRTRAFDALIAVYWKPVYKYIRFKWSASSEDAKDFTQEFFAAAFEKSFFEPYDPDRSKFRTYLRTCVDGVVANSRKAATRIKRGGHVIMQPLDFETAESELVKSRIAPGTNPEEFFDREWVRSLFALAVDDLRAECEASGKSRHFAVFERYDLDPAIEGRQTYAQLAAEFEIPVTQVTNFLSFARSAFRRHLLDRLSRITGSDEEFRAEARRILGVDPQ
jgi:RNA polymerase sigma factor (sigma-70 family)